MYKKNNIVQAHHIDSYLDPEYIPDGDNIGLVLARWIHSLYCLCNLHSTFYKLEISMNEWMNELNTYIPPNIRLITRSLSGSHPIKDSQPMSCLPW